MIPARKSAAFNFVLRRALDRILRRRFYNIYVGGLQHLRALDPRRPVIGCVNHTNWWDGFVLYVLSHRLVAHDIHLAMEEKNLREYEFFTRMGAFGIDLSTPGAGAAGLRYALRLLRSRRPTGAARLVWMFPQGELVPASLPIVARPGARWLAQKANALILPMTLRYEWFSESRPSIVVQVGRPLDGATTATELSDLLSELYAVIGNAPKAAVLCDYLPLYRPRLSINKRWDSFRAFFGQRSKPVAERNG